MSGQPAILIPQHLRRFADEEGSGAAAWVDRLPRLIAELRDRWSLELGEVFTHWDGASWVAPVWRSDATAAILKVGWPHREARYEAAGLRHYDGVGAVRLLDCDEDAYALLLERCHPGQNLWSLATDEGNAVAAAVLRRLWRPAADGLPFERLSDVVVEWCESFARTRTRYPADLVRRAIEVGTELAASQETLVVVHGDFHPGNVLAARREPWLAIDCKPLVGDPAYDSAQFLANRVGAVQPPSDPVREIRRQVAFFADELGLDRDRVAGWAFVKSLGWDWGPEDARVLSRVADSRS